MVEFNLEEKEIETKYKGKVYNFRIKEITGVLGDRIFDEAKTRLEGARFEVSIEKTNKGRILASVIEAKENETVFKLKDVIEKIPRQLYNFLVIEIDKLNKPEIEVLKNLKGQ